MRNEVFILIVFLVGCAPSYSGWEGLMSSNVGKEFYPEEDFIKLNGKRFFSGVNEVRRIDALSREGDNVRYYMTWKSLCKYSILVAPGGAVISWRRESHGGKGCYVL